MTLEELNTLFDAACSAQQRANSEDVSLWSCRGAGLKAVVGALRDEVDRIWVADDQRLGDVLCALDEILGEKKETTNDKQD